MSFVEQHGSIAKISLTMNTRIKHIQFVDKLYAVVYTCNFRIKLCYSSPYHGCLLIAFPVVLPFSFVIINTLTRSAE